MRSHLRKNTDHVRHKNQPVSAAEGNNRSTLQNDMGQLNAYCVWTK